MPKNDLVYLVKILKKNFIDIGFRNNETKENRGISLKRTTRKITSQKGGFLNFLRPLVTDGLLITSLAKSVLSLSGLSAGM